MSRKIIQIAIAATPETRDGSEARVLYALCDDGTVWSIDRFEAQRTWRLVEPIPQDDEK